MLHGHYRFELHRCGFVDVVWSLEMIAICGFNMAAMFTIGSICVDLCHLISSKRHSKMM